MRGKLATLPKTARYRASRRSTEMRQNMIRRNDFRPALTKAEPCAKLVIGCTGFFRYNEAFDTAGREKMIS